MAIPLPRYTAITSPYLKEELMDFAESEHTDENLLFLNSKATNQVIYNTFIKKGSEHEVNLPSDVLKQLNALALANKWNDMSTPLKTARANIEKLTGQVITRYYATERGKRTMVLWRMGLNPSQCIAGDAILRVYFKPRTPEDGYNAYLALMKISSKAKAALTEHGTPPPAKPPASVQDQVNKNLALDKLAKTMALDVKEATRYLDSAIKSVAKDGLPHDPIEVNRMFESGRMRHDKVVLAWNKAIQSDRAFTTKYKTLATDKTKMDTLWAAYRTKLKH